MCQCHRKNFFIVKLVSAVWPSSVTDNLRQWYHTILGYDMFVKVAFFLWFLSLQKVVFFLWNYKKYKVCWNNYSLSCSKNKDVVDISEKNFLPIWSRFWPVVRLLEIDEFCLIQQVDNSWTDGVCPTRVSIQHHRLGSTYLQSMAGLWTY